MSDPYYIKLQPQTQFNQQGPQTGIPISANLNAPPNVYAQQPFPGQIQNQANSAELTKMQLLRFATWNYVNFAISLIFVILMYIFSRPAQSWWTRNYMFTINTTWGYYYGALVAMLAGLAIATIARTVANPANRKCLSVIIIVWISIMILLAIFFTCVFLLTILTVNGYYDNDPYIPSDVMSALDGLFRLGMTFFAFIFYLVYCLTGFSIFFSKAGHYQTANVNVVVGLISPINVQPQI